MSSKKIQKLLEKALLEDGKMEYALYEHELAETIGYYQESMKRDKEHYIFTVATNRGYVAMLLLEKSGNLYINEEARERLKVLWPLAYEMNMNLFIPDAAEQLAQGILPQYGFKVEARKKSRSMLKYIKSLK